MLTLTLRKRVESPLLPLTRDAYYINKGQDRRQN